MVQIRNVPDKVRRQFKARAARAGMSPSDYLLAETQPRLKPQEVEQRLAARKPLRPSRRAAEILREERERR
jgi:antitoxin FitA